MQKKLKQPNNIDSRCPRQLEELPDSWCPLAVLRLKALRNAEDELSEEQEMKLPGCPWAINHQLAGYCFFKYMHLYTDNAVPSESDIAHFLNVSVDTVRKIQKDAIDKIRNTPAFKEIIDAYKDSKVVDDSEDEGEYIVRK